ncbi:hypothetical protein [Metabacillus indicus]|nr:hypothetical protein [Metabacillus indicus]
MKKLLLAIVVFLSGCSMEPKYLTEFYTGTLDEVTKAVITDGSSGYRKTISDQKEIKELMNRMQNVTFIQEENQEDRSGFRYAITFFEGEIQTFQFTINEVDGTYYQTEPDLYPLIDDFYKKLPEEEEAIFH